MAGRSIGFNARAIFALKSDRMYRVYVIQDALYLIRIGGQGGLDALTLTGGALGGAVGAVLSSFLSRNPSKDDRRAASADLQGPQTLLGNHKHNMRVDATDIVETSIEPPAAFPQHGPHVGRWILTTREQKLTLQFETREDMVVALEHLPRLFGGQLKVNVEWNPRKGRFEKPKA
jgi:hypothetical protein